MFKIRIVVLHALKYLLGGTIQPMMQAEIDEHMGYERYDRSKGTNYRNDTKSKCVRSKCGS